MRVLPYVVVVGAISGCVLLWSHDCWGFGGGEKDAVSSPMLDAKEIAVRYPSVGDKENAPLNEVVKIWLTKNHSLIGRSAWGKDDLLHVYCLGLGIIRENRPNCELRPCVSVIQSWLFSVFDLFNRKLPLNILGGSFPVINRVQISADGGAYRGDQIIKCQFYPWALIFAHYVKLTLCDYHLQNGDYDQKSSEERKAVVRKTARFEAFAKSHWILLFIVYLGIGGFGWFCLIFGGYRYCVQEPNALRLVKCVLMCALAFAIVFMLAHASYDKTIPPRPPYLLRFGIPQVYRSGWVSKPPVDFKRHHYPGGDGAAGSTWVTEWVTETLQ